MRVFKLSETGRCSSEEKEPGAANLLAGEVIHRHGIFRGNNILQFQDDQALLFNCAIQLVGEPELDERLSRYAQAAGFPVQRVHHPSGEIDVYSLGISANSPRLAEIELLYDVLTRVKLAV
jgi:hypothetical protein